MHPCRAALASDESVERVVQRRAQEPWWQVVERTARATPVRGFSL